jgi:uncharacterized protein (TIGR02145 family)
MLTNLAYAGGGNTTYGDTKTLTSISGSTASNYTDAQVITTAGGSAVTTAPNAPSTVTGSGGQYGYLYNWCAAMGAQPGACTASGTTPSGYTTNTTICPANWRLPTGGSSGQFKALNDHSTINNGTTSGLTNTGGIQSSWLGVYGGIYTSGLGDQGSYGYYWSSTPYGSSNPNYAYNLSFSSSYVSPTNSYYRYYGFAVRCVL